MQIFLIRHPRPDVAQDLCYGQSDPALVEDPFPIAVDLQNRLPKNIPLFSSPLLRCRLLAKALHNTPLYDDRLKEMHFGEWESQPWSEVPRQQLDQWAADPLRYVIPGGESVAQVQTRVLQFMHEHQMQRTKNMAIVTHAGVMKILAGVTQQLDDAEWMNLHFDYGSLHVVYFP